MFQSILQSIYRNGDKLDNRPENLELFTNNGHHMKYHWSEKKAVNHE